MKEVEMERQFEPQPREFGSGRSVQNRRARLLSLDVFRGISVAGMILVTDPGTYTAVYPQLLHADWRGGTATDMIFPAFLFAAGAAIPLSIEGRLRRGEPNGRVVAGVARRVMLLILIGLLLNAFPAFHWTTLRIPGVLQRIGLCYGAAALLYLGLRGLAPRRRQAAVAGVAIALLVVYWLLLKAVPVPGFGAGHLDTLRSLPAYVDRAVFTVPHLWPYGVTPGVGVTFDPEGILSTIPAIASVLVGVLAGGLLIDRQETTAARMRWVAGAGLALVVFGLLLHPVMPLIKKLWTPSFALLSSGVALLGFALLWFLLDAKEGKIERSRMLQTVLLPARIFGTNAIAAFALSGVITSTLNLLRAGGENWHAWGYAHLFLPWLAPRPASLAYAVAIVALNCGLLSLLYRRGWFLRL